MHFIKDTKNKKLWDEIIKTIKIDGSFIVFIVFCLQLIELEDENVFLTNKLYNPLTDIGYTKEEANTICNCDFVFRFKPINKMKYTSEQINDMSWREWTETMARELNAANFKQTGVSLDSERKLGKTTKQYAVDEDNLGPKIFLLGSVETAKEIDYLKNIGLLNNGRCPMCGNPITGSPGRFTSGYDSNYHFQVCQDCVKKRNRISINTSNQGCIVSLLLLPFSISKYIWLSIFS